MEYPRQAPWQERYGAMRDECGSRPAGDAFHRYALRALLLFVPVLAACGSGTEVDLGDLPMTTGPYMGVLNIAVLPPRGEGRPRGRYGRGHAQMRADESGRPMLVVGGEVDGDEDAAGFSISGTIADGAWTSGPGDTRLRIDADGRISGSGRIAEGAIGISGQVGPQRMRLLVEITAGEQTAGGYPAGTRFQFEYVLANVAPAGSDNGTGSDCREVVYRIKLVPNFSGGGLNSVRVPECVH